MYPFDGFLNGDDSPYLDDGEYDGDNGPYRKRNPLYHHRPLYQWCTHAKAVNSTDKAVLFEGNSPKGKREPISFWVPLKLIRTADVEITNDTILEDIIYIWKDFKPTILPKDEKSS